jgi:hypothetical protein
MPNFADLISSMLNPPDPNDLLRDPMGQGQTLTGMAGKPRIKLKTPMPTVLGPLAAIPRMALRPGKPHIRLKM